jgi:hypothetical protein
MALRLIVHIVDCSDRIPAPVDWHRREHRALTARCYQVSVSRLGWIVRELSANRRVRIRSDIVATNVVHFIGAIGRAPLLLNLRRSGLRSLSAGLLLGAIFGLRKNRGGDQGYQRHSREQFLHGIVSLVFNLWASLWISLWVIALL